MKISLLFVVLISVQQAASETPTGSLPDQLFEIEKVHLENQKKIVELSSNISVVASKIVDNSEYLQLKSEQVAKRIFALSSIQRQQWGLLLFNKNLKHIQKNLTVLKMINRHDSYLISDYRYTQKNLLKQKDILETKRAELLKIDQLISAQQKEISRLENSRIDELKKDNTPSLLLQKGDLFMPANGVIKNSFGSKQDDLEQFSYFISGLYFLVQPHSSVKSVAAGRIVFADHLPYRGLSVVVEHPGQYFSIYSNLDSLTTSVDSEVDKDHVLGKTAASDFYFELRHKNISIDPKNWLKTESKGQL